MPLSCRIPIISKRNRILFFILLFSFNSTAQVPPVNEPDYTKPALFSGLPDFITISEPELAFLFEKSPGEEVQLKMTSSFFYTGYVSSIVILDNPRRISLAIKSSNKHGSALYITKITEWTGSVFFRGRIISHAHIDAYDLVKAGDSSYRFEKKNYYKLISE